ncbi:NAD-dependent epimerase/dehydratase family protein [Actinoalloteichus hymeniacidonis]|uniref:Nucleoside-diphosphate-sugar epimerase n=1 Tax=Actinoalloteichus hymeniacidonis TaxID=340345 RepID=A0AAC9N175_9PSEU|nr:NAD-dependent epimerase/dehydratase family protein [Actinoalloteichus hymeniacidonis]AOS65611.1 nucleoside-diphosphate-sugar epimerase [Actinoalloteichus hymeniacidonis]MBB5906299.1 dihydroflavonol-4-reductase [Actinoalloteichus hymeniacidonis]
MNAADSHDSAAPARTLVTGATGLLGSNIVTALLARGAKEVVALVRDAAKARKLLPSDPRLTLVIGDINDVDSFRDELPGTDAVIHTAAYFREYYQPDPDVNLLHRTNVTAVGNLLAAAHRAGVPVVVHTSSTGTLSAGPAGAPADEQTPPAHDVERSAYRASKVRSEAVVREFCAKHHGLRVPIVLPGWMWGPGDAAPTSAGRLFLSIAGGTLPAVPKAGNHVVDARDVAEACVTASISGVSLRRYIVGGSRHDVADIAARVAELTGAKAPRPVPIGLAMAVAGGMELVAKVTGREPVANRKSVDVLRSTGYPITSARAEHELGVRFRPLHETLADTASWYRERGLLPASATTQTRK